MRAFPLSMCTRASAWRWKSADCSGAPLWPRSSYRTRSNESTSWTIGARTPDFAPTAWKNAPTTRVHAPTTLMVGTRPLQVVTAQSHRGIDDLAGRVRDLTGGHRRPVGSARAPALPDRRLGDPRSGPPCRHRALAPSDRRPSDRHREPVSPRRRPFLSAPGARTSGSTTLLVVPPCRTWGAGPLPVGTARSHLRIDDPPG